MSQLISSRAARYGAAVLATAVAAGLTILLGPAISPDCHVTLYAAVLFSARYCGFGPGLLATVISAVTGAYVFPPLGDSALVAGQVTLVRLGLFMSVGIAISWISSTQRATQRELERRVDERVGEIAKTNRRLKEAEELFRSAFEHAPIGMGLVGLDGALLQVNPVLCALSGYSERELLGKSVVEITHPDDRAATVAHLRGIIAGEGSNYQLERRYLHKDGRRIVWALVNGSVVRDENGKPAHIISQVQDITERKRTEDALQLQSLVLSDMAEGVAVGDRQGIIRFTNPAFEALFGYAPGELIGKHVSVVNDLPPGENERFAAMVIDQVEAKGLFSGEFYNRRKDGTPFLTFARVSAIKVAGEELWVTLQHDITERKRMEKALRESEERFHNAFQYAPIGMALLSFDGQFSKVNRVLCELLGFSEQELLGLSPGDLVHPEDLPAATADAIRLATHEADNYRAERRYRHKSGRIVYTDASLFLLRDHERNPLYYVAQLLDITERQRAEEALRKAHEELEARVEERTADLRESNRQLYEEILQRQQVQYELQNVNSRITGLLESMSAGFFAVDHEWRVTYMNRGAELLTRLDRESVIGKNVWDMFPEDVNTVFGERSRKAMLEWERDDTEFYNAPLSKWLRVHTYPIPDGICALFEDITERHTREASIVSEIFQALNAHLDVANAFPSVTAGLQSLTGCHRVGLALFDDKHENLTLTSLDAIGTYVGPKSPHFPISHSPGARFALAGKPHFVSDLAVEIDSPIVRSVYEDGYRSSLTLPVRANDRIVGMLGLLWRELGGGNASRLPLLGQIADALGLAAEKTRLFQEVRVGHERLQALSGRLMEVQETERRQIARELHDEIGQHLTGLKLVLDAARRLPVESARDRLGEAHELVEELVERTRALSLDLRPAMLDDFGLLPALLWLFDRFAIQTAVQVNFEHRGMDRRLPPEVETAAYRIVQEGLTNVARYADVKEVAVRAWVECETLKLQVVDRGAGFDPDGALSRHGSSGLVGMRERALLLGGRVAIESSPGSGTQVIAELPLRNAAVAVR
jgi:PAS domain S-box-containing protein